LCDQQPRGVTGDLVGGLARGGQCRPRLLGKRAVLEAGNRQVVGHVHAGRLRRGQYAGGNLVVGTEDRGRPVGQRQQFARAAETVVECIVALDDQLRVRGDAVIAQRVFITLEAFRAGAVFLAAPQETDAGVAELDQVLGDVVGRVAVVDEHARITVVRILGCRQYAHEADVVGGEEADQLRILGHRWRQHQAGQPRAPHQIAQLLGQLRRRCVARVDLQAEAHLAAHRQRAVLHGDDVVRVRVVVDQADRPGLGAAQAARRQVGPVVELGNRLEHIVARARLHRRLVVDHPRDGLQRYRGALGDIFDRGGHPDSLCSMRWLV
jgi:hypothetical protein